MSKLKGRRHELSVIRPERNGGPIAELLHERIEAGIAPQDIEKLD
jgi:hypothetical protein